jgi:hypothetical protein
MTDADIEAGLETGLEADLEAAQSALAEAQVIKPDTVELEAIKSFCSLEIKQKNLEKETSAKITELRAANALRKTQLEATMNGRKCLGLSKQDHAKYSAIAAQSAVPELQPYLRIVAANKDATITTDVIQEALESLTDQDFAEQGSIKETVLQKIRLSIRSFTESLKVMASLQRGVSVYEVPELSADEAHLMWLFWRTQHDIKELLAKRKVEPAVAAQKDQYKTRVESFFIRTGLMSQRIVVEGKPYKLVRRISVRKPKIGIGRVEKILDDILQDPEYADAKLLRPANLIKALQIQVSSVAPETKTTVSLSAIKTDD